MYHLIAIFTLVYLEGLFVRIGIPPQIYKLILEGIIVLFALRNFQYLVNYTKIGLLLALIIIVTAISSVYNNQSIIWAFSYLRFIIYGFVIFSASSRKPFSQKEIKIAKRVIVTLLLLQIAGSAIQVFIIQERIEGFVGLMSYTNGTTAVIFPLMTTAFCISLYFFYRPSLIYLLLLLGFLIISYSSGKRAIYFYLPGIFALAFIIKSLFYRKYSLNLKHSHLLLFIPIFGFLYLFGIQNSKGISRYDNSASNFEVIQYAIEYAKWGNTAQDAGNTIGRSSTTDRILEYSLSSTAKLLLGAGPIIMRDDNQEEVFGRLKIKYGITGFTRDIMGIGFLGAILTIIFYLSLFKKLKGISFRGLSSYNRALYFSIILTIFIFGLSHFGYSADFTSSGKISFLILFILGLLKNRSYNTIKERQ